LDITVGTLQTAAHMHVEQLYFNGDNYEFYSLTKYVFKNVWLYLKNKIVIKTKATQ
jgi:hypothetical protein